MDYTLQLTINEELLAEITAALKTVVKEELPKYSSSFHNQWLTTEQVMKMLHVSRRTVQNYRNEGKIPYAQLNRKILYPRAGINAFLQDHLVKPANDPN
jgi:excisionase family DNA binding protein